MAEKKQEIKKSFLEEALLEAKTIQKSAEANAKEILASTMKPEIDRIVKEAIEKENSIDENNVEESHEQTKVAKEKKVEENSTEDDDKISDDDLGEPEVEISDDEPKTDDLEDIGVDQVDLTTSPDNEVIKVFKKMNGDDQLEITKDGDSVNLKDGDAEYHIQLSESEKKKDKLNEEGICECPDHNDEITTDMENNDDEMIYEIELDDKEPVEEPVEETFNVTHADGKNVTLKPKNFNVRSRPGDTRYKSIYQESVEKNKQLVKRFNSLRSKAVKILSENKQIKEKENQYKTALIDLRGKLNEVALFNSNLAYVNKIMSEQATTKQEKINMITRFDKVKSINESKSLYRVIVDELKKEPIKDVVEKKIIKTSQSGASKQINENKSYVDPQLDNQLSRMRSLMNYSTNGK